MIRKIVKYVNEDGFEFTFEPIEETLIIKDWGVNGYEARYLIQDVDPFSPDEDDDKGLFLVNYHSDFQVVEKEVTEDAVRKWYQGEKIPQSKDYFIFPLSCLVHSGVWLSLDRSFGCDAGGWDTSHVGIVLVSKKEAGTKDNARVLAQNLVEVWNMYLIGDVYCGVKQTYTKEKKPVDYDLICGCYGFESAKEGLKDI